MQLDESHETFGEAVRTFLGRTVRPTVDRWEADGIPSTVFEQAGADGFLGIAVDEQYGGSGVYDPVFGFILVRELMDEGLTGFALRTVLSAWVVAPLLERSADETARKRWLPGLASGEVSAAIVGLDEPIRLACATDGYYVIDHGYEAVLGAADATLFVVAAVTDTGEQRMVLVDRNDLGVTVGPRLAVRAAAGAALADVTLTSVKVGEGDLLVADANELAGDCDRWLAVLALCGARAAARLTAEYTSQRKVFGRPLAELENSKVFAARVRVAVESAAALVDRMFAAERVTRSEAALVCRAATEAYILATDLGMQLHGGYGYMKEYPIAQTFADARYLQLLGDPCADRHLVIAG